MDTLLSPVAIDQVERQLAERGAALVSQYDRVESRLDELAHRQDADLKASLAGADGSDRGVIRQVTGRTHAQAASELRRTILAETEAQRQAILSRIDDYERQIETTVGLYRSPVQVLAREKLGDPKRGQYLAQLANAGPAELQSAADLAIATGDRALASAVLVTADRDSKRYSQFDRPAFASRVVGPEVEAMQQRLSAMRITIDAMRKLDRAFSKSGRATMSAQDKIEIGLAKQRLAKREAA